MTHRRQQLAQRCRCRSCADRVRRLQESLDEPPDAPGVRHLWLTTAQIEGINPPRWRAVAWCGACVELGVDDDWWAGMARRRRDCTCSRCEAERSRQQRSVEQGLNLLPRR